MLKDLVGVDCNSTLLGLRSSRLKALSYERGLYLNPFRIDDGREEMVLDKTKPLPKRPRLKYFPYEGTYAYSITILTNEPKEVFRKPEVFQLVFKVLKDLAEQYQFDILAYCFMPEHLHLLVVGKSTNTNLKKFITMFKQKSGFIYKQKYGTRLWHLSYYDHILRKEEDIKTVTRYILNNPVRKGFVSQFKDYTQSGSLVFDIEKL